MSYPNATLEVDHGNGSKTKKYTHSYELPAVAVEIFDPERCEGCPFFVVLYAPRCGFLRQDLPAGHKKTETGSDYYYPKRHPKCPLVKMEERMP